MRSLTRPTLLAMLLTLYGCHGDYQPRPRAYPRVMFPETRYEHCQPVGCPFSFDKPVYSQVSHDSVFMGRVITAPCWINVTFPDFNGTINLTYKEINAQQTYTQLLEDAHKLSFKHTKKANYIDESIIANKHGVHGLYYDVGGEAASNIQFFLTDSVHHFIRGSLYFYNEPNADSMAPVLTFVRKDLDHILSTFEWQ
jgi:gliding motility-associated lipoprotein GldD